MREEIRDSVVVGIRGNVYNWLSYGIVGNSVCRMWESCTLAFPCAVNRVIHDSIACYAHFHNACLLVFGSEQCGAGGLSLVFSFCFFTVHEHSGIASNIETVASKVLMGKLPLMIIIRRKSISSYGKIIHEKEGKFNMGKIEILWMAMGDKFF